MEIKIKEFVDGLYSDTEFINVKGDCIDLRSAYDYEFNAPQAGIQYQKDNQKVRDVKFDAKLIRLGIAMKLPKGFSAVVCQRSSMTKKMKLVFATSGYIDNSYNGNEDEWGLYCYAIDYTSIKKGDRLCQFRIIPNQFATRWQKIKWLFSSKITFKFVKELNSTNRGGHGSTGIN